MDLNTLPERIHVLCCQETTYQCSPYLSPEFQRMKLQESKLENDAYSSFPNSFGREDNSDTNSMGINECWREKICEWSYQVIDHFDFNREVVAVSLSYLDRYLCTRHVNKKLFQLAATTSLYMAIKLYEPSTLRMSSFVELSRGYFTTDHIIAMEQSILSDLSWKMHPPTSLCLVKHLLYLFDYCNIQCSASTKHDIKELARFLCELSVCDYFFVTKKPSTVAVASLATAIDHIPSSRLHHSIKARFFDCVRNITNIEPESYEVMDCRPRLEEMYKQGAAQNPEIMEERGPSPNFVGNHPVGIYDGSKMNP
mmetsp:Transcript_30360/g.35349  ORF Transcript_30360/g.35349 Transcript_30360/m.35349 type:complete len:311 (+) Transcript_30360:119-1051(+)